MTNEEALKVLDKFAKDLKRDKAADAALHGAVHKSMGALKKRLPLPVIYNGYEAWDEIRCRKCGYRLGSMRSRKYMTWDYSCCPECGQKLDWRI